MSQTGLENEQTTAKRIGWTNDINQTEDKGRLKLLFL